MTDSQRLKLFIETALKHGGDLTPYDPESGDTWEAQENGVALYNREREMYLFIPVSTLIYGNGCGLLKAACGEEWHPDFQFIFTFKPYEYVAQESVILPDSKRLQFIVENLRKD